MGQTKENYQIYAFEFEELGIAYVGLTRHLYERFTQHHRVVMKLSATILPMTITRGPFFWTKSLSFFPTNKL